MQDDNRGTCTPGCGCDDPRGNCCCNDNCGCGPFGGPFGGLFGGNN